MSVSPLTPLNPPRPDGTAQPGLAQSHAAHLGPLVPTGGRSGATPGGVAPGSDAGSVVRWSPAALAHGPEVSGTLAPPGGRLAWPSAGLGAQVQGQAAQLLYALAAVAPGTQRPWLPPLLPVVAQAWSPAFLAQWLAERDAPGSAQPPLLAWASQQVQVQTPTGQHSLFLRLLLPGGRLPGEASATRPPAVPAGGAAPVLRWPDSPLLGAGALAWVLAPEGHAALSALLVLEWGPRRETVVYGKDPGLARHDPWVLQAQWLAMGVKERPHSAGLQAPLCDTPDCPYRGQAVCPQPFCPATGAVAAIAPA